MRLNRRNQKTSPSPDRRRRIWFLWTITVGGAALLSGFLTIACGSGATASASSGSAHQPTSSWQAAPVTVVREVTDVPAAVLDSVGLQPTVTPPVALKSQPVLKYDNKPGVYYLGAEP